MRPFRVCSSPLLPLIFLISICTAKICSSDTVLSASSGQELMSALSTGAPLPLTLQLPAGKVVNISEAIFSPLLLDKFWDSGLLRLIGSASPDARTGLSQAILDVGGLSEVTVGGSAVW